MSENPYADINLVKRVTKHIVGRRREVTAIIAALAAGKNVLLEGPPGTTKSTILRSIARECGVPFYMVEGSADLTPQKLIGIFNPAHVLKRGYKPEYFEPGPLTKAMLEGGILYVEEFNRMSEDAANALIRAMEERELVIPRLGVIKARPSFRVIAGMNPYDDVGVGKVSRAVMDRFCRLRLDYQSREEEIEVVKLKTKCKSKWLVELAVDLARATRRHPAVKMGASIRGAIDMVHIVQELKKLKRNYLTFDDLYDAAVLAMSSKMWVRDPDTSPEDIIRELLTKLLSKMSYPDFLKEVLEEREEDEFFREGYKKEVERLLRLSRVAPLRAALELMKSDLASLFECGVGVGDFDVLELYSRTYPYMSDRYRSLAKKFATELVLRIASKCFGGLNSKRLSLGNFKWDSDDIDVDTTVERAVERGALDIDSLTVYKRDKGDRLYALIIDRSASMAGFKIVLAALVAASLTYATSWSSYAVLAFNTRVEFIKRAREPLSREAVVDRILDLVPRGYTDIAIAIREAYKELKRCGAIETIGVLITDGEWTWGDFPLKYAPMFTKLHVIGVPSKWRGFAEAIAIRGHGTFVFVRRLKEVPEAIRRILSS